MAQSCCDLCVCLQSGSGAVVGAVRRDTGEMDMRGTLFRTVSWGQTRAKRRGHSNVPNCHLGVQ